MLSENTRKSLKENKQLYEVGRQQKKRNRDRGGERERYEDRKYMKRQGEEKRRD